MKNTILKTAVLFTLLTSVTHAKMSINETNSLIKQSGKNWIAKENPISKLSDVEIKRLLGSQELPSGHGLVEDLDALGNESLDWRNKDGINWLGEVLNQGNCGSCVAFAATAAFQDRYTVQSKLPWVHPLFSPQQLFSCGGGSCDRGWTPGSSASFLKNKGIVDAACSPYVSGSTGEDMQCKSNFCENQSNRLYKIANFSTPTSFWSRSASKVKEALKNGPLVTTMTVYSDFTNYAGGIYNSVSNKSEGGHAVELVGFNDQERYWIVKNSWGKDWGENGFVRISYDDKSGIAESTWAYETNKQAEYISIQSPSNREYISGEKEIIVQTQNAVGSKVVIKGADEEIALDDCMREVSKKCSQHINTLKLQDGRYEIMAIANGIKSIPQEIFVVNHEPTISVSFKGADGVDLSKAQKGRIEFDVKIISSTVIPQKINLIVVDTNGQVVAKRSNDQVVPNMRMGFRTNNIANGTYRIYFTTTLPVDGVEMTSASNVSNLIVKN